MTTGDWIFDGALLVGLLANAGAILFGMRRIDKKQDRNRDLVNGRVSELIEEVRTAAIAKGLQQGRDESKP